MSLLCCGALACTQGNGSQARDDSTSYPPLETAIAVAPALNFSASPDFDPVQVADLMASELSSVPGLGVIGPNRVLAILAERGLVRIQSPEHALEVCDRLGVETILVFAVTEYDAYTPVVGLAAQIYGKQPEPVMLDPVAASRMARPFPVADVDEGLRPWAQVQRVFNGMHGATRRDVERYAASRDADESPFGWRKYLRSQRLYLRYCCSRVARELTAQSAYGHAEAVATATRTEEFGP